MTVRLVASIVLLARGRSCGCIHAIDEIASYVSWVLSNAPDFDTSEWVGKTYDLTAAYKQFGIAAKDIGSF